MQMKFDKTVYVETSVASYLTAGTFTNPAKIARQLATTDWLNFWGLGFELYTSDLTIEEAERGHHGDAAQALKALDGITNLPITNAVNTLADVLTLTRALPPDSRNDAVHVALAAVHDIDYILTWKSRLLDKEVTGPNIRQVCEQHRYRSPETCTPHALVGEEPIWYDEILEELWEIRYNMSYERGKSFAPIDVPARLDEFKEVENGWLDGEGIAPSHDGLDWLIGAFRSHFPSEAMPTRCYLARDGRVRMEWFMGSNFMSFQVDLPLHTGGWLWSNSESRDSDHGDLDLDKVSSWDWLVSEIKDKQAQSGEQRVTI